MDPRVLLIVLISTLVAGDLEWWQDIVVYQIYPRSFKDNNDDGVGDIQGIISKLDYIQGLGVKGVWLSPIYPSPGADAGYDISNYTDIDPMFGTMKDFDELLSEVHDRGMYLIMDFVPNHTSDEHAWFIESMKSADNEYSDYYIWKNSREQAKPPNNWLSYFRGDAWEYVPDRDQWYLHQFHKKQPDLNYRNPKVVEEIKNVLRFWLDKGVDGFRMDIVPALFEDEEMRDEPVVNPGLDPDDRGRLDHIYTENLPESFEMIEQFRAVLNEYKFKTPNQPKRVMMTEAYASITVTNKWYGTAERDGAHFPFNFGVITGLNKDSKAKDYVSYVARYMAELPTSRWPDWVIGNHDQRRVATRFGSDKIDMMNTFNLLLPGTGITYMGEEIGMEDNTDITYQQGQDPQGCNAGPDKYAENTRDFERSPFQWDNTTSAGFSNSTTTWLPVNSNYLNLNVAEQEAADESHLKFYKKLVKLREEPSVRDGTVFIGEQNDDVFGFLRERPSAWNVTAIFNMGDKPTKVDFDKLFPGRKLEWYTLYAKSPTTNLTEGMYLVPENFTIPEQAVAVFIQ